MTRPGGGNAGAMNLGHDGYVALMSVIVIGTVLLMMVAAEGDFGWRARFHALGMESKERARALAESCADQAVTRIFSDPSYVGDAASVSPAGACRVFPVAFNTPAPGIATIKTQAEVSGFYVNLTLTARMRDACGGASLPPWQEVPTHE